MTKATSFSMATMLLLACSCGSATEEQVASSTQPILGGAPSGDDEDAVVRVEIADAQGNPSARCSGYLVAPNLVLTARHCALTTPKLQVHCSPDGTAVAADGGAAEDPEALPPERITVHVGADVERSTAVAVRSIVAEYAVGLCTSDLAFLVLTAPAMDTRAAIRAGRVRIGEQVRVSGWGFTSDAEDALPSTRTTLDAVPVTDVGPGLLPSDSFALPGDTLCFGDSGSAARVDGVVVGVYSRIEGPACSLAESRNVFTALGAHVDVVERAFAAAGATPWLVDVPTAPDAADGGAASAAPSPATTTPPAPATNDMPAAASRKLPAACSVASPGRSVPAPTAPLAVIVGLASSVLAVRRRARASRGRGAA